MKSVFRIFTVAAVFAAVGFMFAGCEGPAGIRGPVGPQEPNLVVDMDIIDIYVDGSGYVTMDEGDIEFVLLRGRGAVITAVAVPFDDTIPATLPTLIWELYDVPSNDLISLVENRPGAVSGGFPLLSGNSIVVTGLAGGEARILITALGSGAGVYDPEHGVYRPVRNIITVRVDDVGQRIADLPRRIAELEDGAPAEFTIYTVIADEPIRPQLLCFDGRPVTVTLASGQDNADILRLNAPGAMFTVGPGVTLNLGNIILEGMAANTSALVVVNGGYLEMGTDSKITGNINTLPPTVANEGRHGGGVRVGADGTFTMEAGVISNNTSSIGGGVFNQGTFNLENGDISRNVVTAPAASGGGGGVANWEGGTFHMRGGTIYRNTSANGGGVLEFGTTANPSTFTMDAGVISFNTSTSNGGGVTTLDTFTMNGGSILNNTANAEGGGVNNLRGVFYMHDGAVISGNTAVFGGGVANRAAFTMFAGGISNNTVSGAVDSGGGGVCNWNGTFNMRGGEISGNTAVFGGGVDNWNGTFRISDGIIHGIDAEEALKNTATATDDHDNPIGAVLITGPLRAAARYGTFDNGDFTGADLTDTVANNATIEVADGELIRPVATGAGPVHLDASGGMERSGRMPREGFNDFR